MSSANEGKWNEYKELLRGTVIRGDVSKEAEEEAYRTLYAKIYEICPPSLYRFRSCTDYNFDSLLHDTVYFNPPKSFNDPHDCLYFVNNEPMQTLLKHATLEDARKMLIDIRNGFEIDRSSVALNMRDVFYSFCAQIQAMSDAEFDAGLNGINECAYRQWMLNMTQIQKDNHESNVKYVREKTYVACFTEELTSTLMWAHYAEFHRGFALEYDINVIKSALTQCQICKTKCSNAHRLELYPVVYGEERYDATEHENEFLNYLMRCHYNHSSEPFIFPDKLYNIKCYTNKGNDWRYEREWRLIYSLIGNDTSAKYAVIRPKAIYLGSEISDANKGIILKIIEGKNLDIYEMYVDTNNRKYALSSRALK